MHACHSRFFFQNSKVVMPYGNRRRRLGGYSVNYSGVPYRGTWSGSSLYPMAPNRKRRRPIPDPAAPLRMGRRVRVKLTSGSSTKTKQTTRMKKPKIRKTGENSTFSQNVIRSRASRIGRLYRQLSVPQVIQNSVTGRIESGVGQQNVDEVSINAVAELVAMKNTVTGGATNRNAKMFLRTCKMKTLFRNQANSMTKLTIYDIVLKNNPGAGATVSPRAAWEKGMLDNGFASNNFRIVDSTPFRSREFTYQYGVNAVTTVDLEAGQQHEHTVYYKYNRLFDTVHFENHGNAIPRFTRFVMWVVRGSLAHETATPTSITYTNNGVDVSVIKEFSYAWIAPPAASNYVNNVSFPTTFVNLDQMGEGGDVDNDPVNA